MDRYSVFVRFVGCVLLICVLTTGSCLPVMADTPEQIQTQIEQLEEENAQLQLRINEIQAQLRENADALHQMLAQKNLLEEQIATLHAQADNIHDQITAHNTLIAINSEQLEQAQENLDQLNAKYKERIRAMEERGLLDYWSVLFHASSFTDFLDRLNMIQQIAAADQQRLQQLRDAQAQVVSAQAILSGEKEALRQSEQRLLEAQNDIEEKSEEVDRLLRELIAQGDAYEALLEESEKTQEALMQELAQKESEYDAALYQQWLENQGSADEPNPDPPVQNTSQWLTPLPYYTLTSPFGMRFHPILGYNRMHNGVDLAAAAGTPIYASRSGVVTTAAYQPEGAGYYVQLDHGDGYRSIYMHMTSYIVSYGEFISAGQVIGYVGNTGLSKGNHLHFGISFQGTYVNPMEYIG